MHQYTHLHPPYPFAKPEETLHVLAMYSNPVRYHARARLFTEFVKRVESVPHVQLHIVEVALGRRHFEVTNACNPNHLQLRTNDQLWHKENALNLLAQRLPHDWKYCCWLDGDIAFDNKADSWALETIHLLQHYQIVQMFDRALDLDVHGNVMHIHRSAVSSWKANVPFSRQYGSWHPGYGWAYTREAWNGIGGLVDFAILGSGDDHMMKGLLGKPAVDSLPKGVHPNYSALVGAWSDHAVKVVKFDIGYLPVTIRHFYHGAKANRNYWGRWDVLTDKAHGGKHPFDPLTDLKRDWQGLWQLTDKKLHIRDGIRDYMAARNEDANV